MFLLAFVLLLQTQFAHATLYFTAYDPESKAIALAYSSSGANFWQTMVKDKGMIGAQNGGLCGSATPKKFLIRGLSSEQIALELKQQCDKERWTDYRLSIITTDGQMTSYIAKTGCTQENAVCGNRATANFQVTGGGLNEGVLEKAVEAWESLEGIPFACRIYKTLDAIYKAGGEKNDFRGASIGIDDPSLSDLIYWKAKDEKENKLLPNIKMQMEAAGFECDTSP